MISSWGERHWYPQLEGISLAAGLLSSGGAAAGQMGRLGLVRVMDCFSLLPSCTGGCTCLCVSSVDDDDEDRALESKALIPADQKQTNKLKGCYEGNKTLAFFLEPKTVVLRVSMHCNGCRRKVEKHIAKMEGVTSFQVDMETKKVVVEGDINPFEVLESISKIKFAQLWTLPDQ